MFGIGGGELAIILVFGFLLFGPDKLPQMGRTIGRALRQFRETQEKLTAVVQTEVVDPMTAAATAPVKPKKAAAVDDDSDADAPAADAPEARKETFAERRARLAAEKAEREAAAAGDAAPAAEPAPVAEEAASAEEPASAPAEPEPAPAPRTTEDLYARRPRKAKAEEPAEESAATDAATEEGGDR